MCPALRRQASSRLVRKARKIPLLTAFQLDISQAGARAANGGQRKCTGKLNNRLNRAYVGCKAHSLCSHCAFILIELVIFSSSGTPFDFGSSPINARRAQPLARCPAGIFIAQIEQDEIGPDLFHKAASLGSKGRYRRRGPPQSPRSLAGPGQGEEPGAFGHSSGL